MRKLLLGRASPCDVDDVETRDGNRQSACLDPGDDQHAGPAPRRPALFDGDGREVERLSRNLVILLGMGKPDEREREIPTVGMGGLPPAHRAAGLRGKDQILQAAGGLTPRGRPRPVQRQQVDRDAQCRPCGRIAKYRIEGEVRR